MNKSNTYLGTYYLELTRFDQYLQKFTIKTSMKFREGKYYFTFIPNHIIDYINQEQTTLLYTHRLKRIEYEHL